MPSTDELERQGITGRQLKALLTSWIKIAAEYKAKQIGIRKFYAAEVRTKRARSELLTEESEVGGLPPRRRTRQVDIRQFGEQSAGRREDGSSGGRDVAGEGGSREAEAGAGENAWEGEETDDVMQVNARKPNGGRRRRIVMGSESEGDEGDGRPNKRGRRQVQTEGYGEAEGGG